MSAARVLGSTGTGVLARTRFGVGAKSAASASWGVFARCAREARRRVRRYAFAMRREIREDRVDGGGSRGGLRSVKVKYKLAHRFCATGRETIRTLFFGENNIPLVGPRRGLRLGLFGGHCGKEKDQQHGKDALPKR
jgi:hypothetical protein